MVDRTLFMRRFYDEVYNRRNVAFLRQHLHPEVLGHGPGVADLVAGIETVVAFSQYVYEVYTDYHLEVNNVVAEGDQVLVRGTVTASHIPTGLPVTFCGMTLYRFDGDLIREYWRYYDRHDLYDRQLRGWRPG